MSTQWGVFGDEGCIEAQLWSREEAEDAAAGWRADGEESAVAEPICPDHEEQPKDDCQECATDTGDDAPDAHLDDDDL